MNPYTAVRRTLIVIGHVLKWTLLLALVLIFGGMGFGITGQWWGWVAGPVFGLGILVTMGLLMFGLSQLPEWWKRKERLYRERQRTAHGESNPVTN